MWDGDGDGDTLFFGSRESGRHGRLYDKEMESLDPAYANCWRYEVEYKGDVSPVVYAHLSGAQSLTEAAFQILVGQFAEWNAPLPLRSLPPGLVLRVPSEETTLERQERWLLAQVLPTLARLVDEGHRDVVDRLFRQAYNEEHG